MKPTLATQRLEDPTVPDLLEQGRRCYPLAVSWIAELGGPQVVSPRSQFLCAALSALASGCHADLGARRWSAPVAEAATLLALLTKVDDDVIDSLAFHGGHATDRRQLSRKTRAYLAPTLQSIEDGRPANAEPRCRLAAELGSRLQRLAAHPRRLQQLLHWIARGWEVQVQAVSVLTAHPGQLEGARVEQVSAAISEAWLLMITLVGSLPADARRGLDAAEEAAFTRWGGPIQRVDALADLTKDVRDGHGCTVPGWLLYQAQKQRYLDAVVAGDAPAVYRMLARHDVDLACLPASGWYDEAAGPLARLPQVAQILRWIHGFLVWRYAVAPGSRRDHQQPQLVRCMGPHRTHFSAYITHVMRVITSPCPDAARPPALKSARRP